MSSALKSLTFAIILSIVCSLLLTTASTGLKSYQQRNIRIDRHKNILQAAGLIDDSTPKESVDVEKVFEQKIQSFYTDATGRIVSEKDHAPDALPIWLYTEKEAIQAYIIPINTRGLWGEINGYLAFEADGETIRGFTVYNHSETPGLGGEIEKRWFRKNFVGKKVVNDDGAFVSIGIAKGSVEKVIPSEKQENYVDGISGATLTGKFLTSGLADILQDYEPVAIQFRNKRRGKTTLSPE